MVRAVSNLLVQLHLHFPYMLGKENELIFNVQSISGVHLLSVTTTEQTEFPWLVDAGTKALSCMKLHIVLVSTTSKVGQTETNTLRSIGKIFPVVC